ncbi:MAG: hypothetical protein IT461_01920 [Planctomycetes bacterium]|nr:hypothetical protein [Planctomycetota bacterium]
MPGPIKGAKPQDYAVGTPSKKKNWTEPDCQPFDDISHVTHIANAVAIAREGVLRPRLVWDESCLNQTRTMVCWLSPNYWQPGSRYGHIELKFDWGFYEGREAYWVEAIDYKHHACRILLTDSKSAPRSLNLQRYDPVAWNGPWGVDSKGKHWWNNDDLCLEILLHDEIPARAVKSIDFVKHHDNYCSLHKDSPEYCPDIKVHRSRAGAEFVAALVAGELHGLDHALRAGVASQWKAADSLQEAWNELRRLLTKGKHVGKVGAGDSQSHALGRSLLAAIARRSKSDHEQLLSLFTTEDEAAKVVRGLVAEHFDVAPHTLDLE